MHICFSVMITEEVKKKTSFLAKHVFFLFGSGTVMCLTLAAGGWQANLIVYLIREYNVKSIDAAQISNVVSGCTSLFPVIGAFIADSFLGCFPVIFISSGISYAGKLVTVSLSFCSYAHTCEQIQLVTHTHTKGVMIVCLISWFRMSPFTSRWFATKIGFLSLVFTHWENIESSQVLKYQFMGLVVSSHYFT